MIDTVIISAAEAAVRTFPYRYAHISICDPDIPDYPLAPDPNRVAMLRLRFFDYRELGNPMTPIASDLAPVVPFVREQMAKVDGFVVNCAAGISRSSGVAAGISELLGLSDVTCYILPRNPNPVVRGYIEHAIEME